MEKALGDVSWRVAHDVAALECGGGDNATVVVRDGSQSVSRVVLGLHAYVSVVPCCARRPGWVQTYSWREREVGVDCTEYASDRPGGGSARECTGCTCCGVLAGVFNGWAPMAASATAPAAPPTLVPSSVTSAAGGTTHVSTFATTTFATTTAATTTAPPTRSSSLPRSPLPSSFTSSSSAVAAIGVVGIISGDSGLAVGVVSQGLATSSSPPPGGGGGVNWKVACGIAGVAAGVCLAGVGVAILLFCPRRSDADGGVGEFEVGDGSLGYTNPTYAASYRGRFDSLDSGSDPDSDPSFDSVPCLDHRYDEIGPGHGGPDDHTGYLRVGGAADECHGGYVLACPAQAEIYDNAADLRRMSAAAGCGGARC